MILKNNAIFIKCISNINNVLIDNAEDLDIVIPMFNLIEYSKNYSKTSGTLWNYTIDIPTDPITNSESFKYNTSITGKTGNDGNTKEVEFFVPLKHLSNFWKTLILTCLKICVITDETTQDANPNANPPVPEIRAPTNAIFEITHTKLYVPVVTLSTNKLLDQLKTRFKITIKLNKYRSEMTNLTKTNNLNYLIDPTFSRVNRIFVLPFENEEDRTSFSKYYTRKVEIKYFTLLIDGKSFLDVPINSKEETYEKIIEMSKNNDYTTGNLLRYDNFFNHYKLIAIDLRKQVEL